MGTQGSLLAGGTVVGDPVVDVFEPFPEFGWAVDVGELLLIHFIRSLTSWFIALASHASRSLWLNVDSRALTQSLRAINWN